MVKTHALIGGILGLVALGWATQVLAQAPPTDRRPPGIARPVGGRPDRPSRPNRPEAGRPDHRPPHNGHPGRPGHHPPPHHGRPGRPGHHPPPHRPGHRPTPWPIHRPPHRPNYGWNGHRYRVGLFRYPSGYAYQSWGRGQRLPPIFLSPAYVFTNYAMLGLDAPPDGSQWVRYGPDLILVDSRTGEILDVIDGVFY
ncbi:MAG: RcnB family protein [Caulobacteraceae bacterium]